MFFLLKHSRKLFRDYKCDLKKETVNYPIDYTATASLLTAAATAVGANIKVSVGKMAGLSRVHFCVCSYSCWCQ
jgi:hypothetical protein